jgi:hypothetical protein
LRLRVRLLTVLGGIVVGLLIAEAGLRAVGFRYLNLSKEDRDVGYSLRPGAEGWWTREAETYIKINSDGLRDREHAKEKPPGTLRVAVLGDSYAEALQVPLENTFWSVAEGRLQSSCGGLGGRRVEFINFGVSGFSTARELITLRRRVWQYSPDVVMLLVTTGNDIRDNSKILSGKYAGEPLPYFVYENGALVLDDSLLKRRNESPLFRLRESRLGSLLGWLRDNVRLAGLFYKAREAARAEAPERPANANDPGYEPGLDSQIYLEPADGAWADAWKVTEGLILLMRDEVEARGARFLVVTGSNGIQVYPDPAVRQRFARALGAEDLFYPERRLRALGERGHVDVLSLAPALQEYADRSGAILHGTQGRGHWNVLGHRLVGEAVADRLCETITANQ